MINQQLIEWIRSEEAQGYSEQELITSLIKQGYNQNDINEAIISVKQDKINNSQNTSLVPHKHLRYSAISGIISLILLMFIFFFGVIRYTTGLEGTLITLYAALLIISLPITLIYIYGFVLLGDFTKNKLLKFIAFISLIFSILVLGFALGALYYPSPLEFIISSVLVIFGGVIELILGISFLKLKKSFGNLATVFGVLEIIKGISYITLLLSFLGLILCMQDNSQYHYTQDHYYKDYEH